MFYGESTTLQTIVILLSKKAQKVSCAKVLSFTKKLSVMLLSEKTKKMWLCKPQTPSSLEKLMNLIAIWPTVFFKATSCVEPEIFYRRVSTIAGRGRGQRHLFGNFIMFWRNLNFARGYGLHYPHHSRSAHRLNTNFSSFLNDIEIT